MGDPVTASTNARAPWALVRVVAVAPFTRPVARSLAFCLAGVPFLLVNPLVLFLLVVDLTWLATTGAQGDPSVADIVVAVVVVGFVLTALVSTGGARRIGSWQRALARRLLDVRVGEPPDVRAGRGARIGVQGHLRDIVGWKVIAYLTIKLPVVLLGVYSAFFWVGGLVNLSYPLWWGAFRNAPSGVRLDPVPVFTPLGLFGDGTFRVATLPGTFVAAAAGAAMLFVAPWVARAVIAADAWLIRHLLGPDGMAQRVAELEATRALAVDDSAALIRRLERDLHDGAQIRLATVAMNLGMAREKLGEAGDVPDPDAARDLVEAALRGAKDAIGDLRSLVRGIHPPVLDNGLGDALASLAIGGAIPVELDVDVPTRPGPAIETIVYFCAAELVANATKHSHATTIVVRAVADQDVLRLTVYDDGSGGAVVDASRGSGLAGLAHRVAVVDGTLAVVSPPGGPTTAAVEIPLSR